MTVGVDRHELRRIIAGLSEGAILVEPDQTIPYANEAALAMHGTETADELGETLDAYRDRFALRYRNNHAPNQFPMERAIAGVIERKRAEAIVWGRNTRFATGSRRYK